LGILKHNFISIESLRAWMAWWVVFGHMLDISGLSIPQDYNTKIIQFFFELARSGGTPVDVFIILSGFVVTHLILGSKARYPQYLMRRALRIFPIYLFCLLLSILTVKFYSATYVDLPYAGFREMQFDRLVEQDKNFSKHLLLHLTLLHGLVPDNILKYSSGSILPPAWSLSLEWQFYLIAPALVLLLTGSPKKIFLILFGLMTIYVFVKYGLNASWQYPAFLPLRLNGFIVGILSRTILGTQFYRFRFGFVFLMFAAFLLVGAKASIIWMFFYIVALSEINLIEIPSKTLKKVVGFVALNAKISNVGKWSYSTYLLHIPFLTFIVGGYVVLFGSVNTPRETVVILLCIAAPVLLGLSWFTYHFIEKPFIQLGKRGIFVNQRS
jgi:peptidoglycan/LPS O-acetylase OafA/YrhL